MTRTAGNLAIALFISVSLNVGQWERARHPPQSPLIKEDQAEEDPDFTRR